MTDIKTIVAERDHFRDFAKDATAKMTNYAGGGSELFHSEKHGMFLADVDACIERYGRRFETQQSALRSIAKRLKSAERELSELRADRDRLREAGRAVVAAEDDFRSNLPKEWEGDPLTDAVAVLRAALNEGKNDEHHG